MIKASGKGLNTARIVRYVLVKVIKVGCDCVAH